MSNIVLAAPAVNPASVAIASIAPWKTECDLWQQFPKPELLWLAMMDAGGKFCLRRHSYNDAWDFIPPSGPLTDDEALAVAWGQQALDRFEHGDHSARLTFDGRGLFPHTWSLAYAAEASGLSEKRIWELVRNGALGGYETRRGMWQVAPGSVKRYQQRQQQAA